MSNLYLPLALVSTFAAVALLAMTVENYVVRRRRTVRLLESQVGNVSTDLREQELSQSFLDRVVVPVASGVGGLARRLTPNDARTRIAKKLILAGNPPGWDADKIAAFKVMGLVGGGLLGVLLTRLIHPSAFLTLAIIGLGAFAGFTLPSAMLGGAVSKRQEAIRKALPDTMDLLTISVEAGMGFDAALAHVIRNVPGPLSEEIGRMLHEVQLGETRVEAFRHLADRTDVEELRGFVLAMIQADIFGVSIANVLRAQAKELRVKRRQRAERKAMQTPVKLIFPLIFCLLPALMITVVGPAIIRLSQTFFH
jgi:tight adherence protein C